LPGERYATGQKARIGLPESRVDKNSLSKQNAAYYTMLPERERRFYGRKTERGKKLERRRRHLIGLALCGFIEHLGNRKGERWRRSKPES